MFYMFQAVSPPIIRSSNLYTQHLLYVVGQYVLRTRHRVFAVAALDKSLIMVL